MTPEEVMARYEAAASAHDLSAAIRLIDPEALHCGDRGTATGGSAGIDRRKVGWWQYDGRNGSMIPSAEAVRHRADCPACAEQGHGDAA
jgi:hypothetical protein